MEGDSDFAHNTGWPIKAHRELASVLFARVLSFLESTKELLNRGRELLRHDRGFSRAK